MFHILIPHTPCSSLKEMVPIQVQICRHSGGQFACRISCAEQALLVQLQTDNQSKLFSSRRTQTNYCQQVHHNKQISLHLCKLSTTAWIVFGWCLNKCFAASIILGMQCKHLNSWPNLLPYYTLDVEAINNLLNVSKIHYWRKLLCRRSWMTVGNHFIDTSHHIL